MIRMKVVSGPVVIGAGTLLELTEAQYRPRAHKVEVVQAPGKTSKVWGVEASVPLDFKAGEVVGVVELPKHLGDRVVDLDAAAKAAAEEAARLAAEEEARRKAADTSQQGGAP